MRYDGKRKTAAPARWASERGSRGATPEGRDGEWLRRREDDGDPGGGGSRGSRSASAAQVTMELRRRPISTLKKKKKASAPEDYPFHYRATG